MLKVFYLITTKIKRNIKLRKTIFEDRMRYRVRNTHTDRNKNM